MSIATFIDIRLEEQVVELLEYYKALGADEVSSELDVEDYVGNVTQAVNLCELTFKENNELEAESALNSVVSLIVMVPPENTDTLVNIFCEKLGKAPTHKLKLVSLRVLNNLFHNLGERAPQRYIVHFTMVQLAGQTDSVSAVFRDVDKMKQWMSLCGVPTEKLQRYLRLLHETLMKCNQSDLASKVMVELLSTYTEENASQAREDAHRCIVASLGDPNIYLLDHLLTLKPVKFLEGEPIHDLLSIFVSEKLLAYLQFYQTNKEFVDSLGLSHDLLSQKIRFLTFMQMSESRKEVPYDMLQQELQIASEDVEAFIIDVLRTKLVRAKIDQFNKKVLISSTMHRTFNKQQWNLLRESLFMWHNNLQQIKDSLFTVSTLHRERIVAATAAAMQATATIPAK